MGKRKIQTVQDIIVNEAIGSAWAILETFVIIMAAVCLWYRWDAIMVALGL